MKTLCPSQHHYAEAARYLHAYGNLALAAAEHEGAADEVLAIVRVKLHRDARGVMPRMVKK